MIQLSMSKYEKHWNKLKSNRSTDFSYNKKEQSVRKRKRKQMLRSKQYLLSQQKICFRNFVATKDILSYNVSILRQLLTLSPTAISNCKGLQTTLSNIIKNGVKFSKRVENTVGKREIARFEKFLLFPWCFQKTCTVDT